MNSSVLKWPDAGTVDRAARAWAAALAATDPAVVAVGYLGSYARGDWGVGSDLDLLVIREPDPDAQTEPASVSPTHDLPDVTGLPVPADLLVLTTEEWSRGLAEGRRFHRTARREAVWVIGQPPDERRGH